MPTSRPVQRLAGPAVFAALGLTAAAGLTLLGPQRMVPLQCPFLALTGLDCPLCGGTRSTAALVRGDLAAAVDLNVLTTVAVVMLAGVWAAWLVARTRGRSLDWVPSATAWRVVLVVTVVFTVLRNLPGPSAVLAP